MPNLALGTHHNKVMVFFCERVLSLNPTSAVLQLGTLKRPPVAFEALAKEARARTPMVPLDSPDHFEFRPQSAKKQPKPSCEMCRYSFNYYYVAGRASAAIAISAIRSILIPTCIKKIKDCAWHR